jgi:hypothetical protein
VAYVRRALLFLTNESRLFRSAVPIHLVALLQPSLMYALMTLILVTPTFDMVISRPTTPEGRALVQAMRQVGSPVGEPYINPVVTHEPDLGQSIQKVTVDTRDGVPTATQHFALVDSNQVKNYRNRLTAAALKLWNDQLGGRAVTIRERPWLPRDIPYKVYFGMALLPMATFLASSLIGAVLTAQDFEQGTVLEYSLSPAPLALVLGARLCRLLLTGLLSAAPLVLTMGLMTGFWPRQPAVLALVLVPIATLGGCLGMTAALLLQSTIPSFVIALGTSLAAWIMGGAFGLPAGFSSLYAQLSHLSPNSYTIELLFPQYYGIEIGSPVDATLALILASVAAAALTTAAYRRKVPSSRGMVINHRPRSGLT